MPSVKENGKYKFSILVPVYNTEQFLDDCINSVLAQNYKNFELLLVDDGSTDGSGNICDRYSAQDGRIRVFHKPNSGLMHTRRFAIERCMGDFVIFLDSDDVLLGAGVLKTLAQEFHESGSDCIVYGYKTLSGREEVYATPQETEHIISDKRTLYKKVLQNSTYNALWRKAVRRSIFKGTDFSKYYHIAMGEDLLQSLEIYKFSHQVSFISDCLYGYRVNPRSITHSIVYDRYEPDFTVNEATLSFLTQEKVFAENDMKQYLLYLRGNLVGEVAKICKSSASYRIKTECLRRIRDTGYCNTLIRGNVFVKGMGAKKKLVLMLLKIKAVGFITLCYKL